MAELNFDATQVAPNEPFAVLPAGKYIVQVEASEMKPTKNGDGQYLWLELSILDGEHAGRKLFDRLNLVNQSQQAVEIAQRTLSAICHATGQLHVSDSEQLHGRPMVATVRVRPGRMDSGKQFDASNEIRGYEPTSGAAPAANATPFKSPAKQPDAVRMASPAVPPWRKKAS